MPGFDRQSARRISNTVRGFEQLRRSRTPRISPRDNASKNPFYWAIALTEIPLGSAGTVQLTGSDHSGISGETRSNVHNDYQATVWLNSKCLVTVVDGEFRIVAADAATFLLCSTVGTVTSANATFNASVIADLDGHFNDATITAHNTFSQDYDPSELFLAFRDEQNSRWVADKVGGSGGNEALVRFALTEAKPIADLEAAAEILDQSLVGTGEFVIVHDRVGEWAGAIGYQGIAFRGDNVGGEYDIVFLEGKARWVRGTLNGNVDDGDPIAVTVEDYFGGPPNGRNPGTTVDSWDETGDWFFLKGGDRVFCVLDEKQDRYIIVWGEFRADTFSVTLTPDGGVVGVNAQLNCTLTYTVRNADTGDLLKSNVSPIHPRPSLTQMIPASKGIAHWEEIEEAAELILDYAFEVATPRLAVTVVSSVVCNPTTGIDVYTQSLRLPVGSAAATPILAATLLCVGGGGGFNEGCGIVETTPGSGVYQVNPNDLAGDGIAVDGATSCGLKVDHDTCSLELIGTSPNKQLNVRLKSAGGLDCSNGLRIDPAVVTNDVIKSISGCILEIDEAANTLKLTLEYQPYTIGKNSAGVPISGSFGAETTLTPCTVGVEECP